MHILDDVVFMHIFDAVIFMLILDAVIFMHVLDAVIFMHVSNAFDIYQILHVNLIDRFPLVSIYTRNSGSGALGVQCVRNPGPGGTFFDCGYFCYRENGQVESFMRRALTGSFERSNRELLALDIC